MTLRIDIPPELEAQLVIEAQAAGTSPEQLIRKVLEREFARNQGSSQPFRSYRGALAKYGPGHSAADIDENRREMFASGAFARGD